MTVNNIKISAAGFKKILLNWNSQENKRQMPWKGEADPYKIWLSEIILQQTRVDQGLKYYQSFVANFPTISHLALAPDEKVFKLWEGLGYYSRCKNLLATARFVHQENGGVFPTTHEAISRLKGVGPYTAAAIASFAFNLPHAVVDGNVYRVLARVFGIDTPIDSTAGKKVFAELAGRLLDQKNPAASNQAIMDFGATICKPKNPECPRCVFQKKCIALAGKAVTNLPVKEKQLRIRNRVFYYLVCRHGHTVYIRKRPAGDIWENLHEFPLAEPGTATVLNRGFIKKALKAYGINPAFDIKVLSGVYRQKLTHQHIEARFAELELAEAVNIPGFTAVLQERLADFAFPRLINAYLSERWRQPALF